jgi:Acyl-CoA dehydrogenase, C-terminal domain
MAAEAGYYTMLVPESVGGSGKGAVSTEMATRVIDRVIQTRGGMGITSEIYFAEAWQMARTVQIADGSAEMF